MAVTAGRKTAPSVEGDPVADRAVTQAQPLLHWLVVAGLVLIPLVFVPDLVVIFPLPKQLALVVWAGCLMVALASARPAWPFPARVTIPLAIVGLAEVLSLMFAFDQRSSILGAYVTRMGFFTHAAIFVAFIAAAASVRDVPTMDWVFRRAWVAPVLVMAYAVIQRMGLDPVDFGSVNTVDNVVSTIGNRNELPAFGLLCLAMAPSWFDGLRVRFPKQRSRFRLSAADLCLAGVVASVTIVSTMSESRGAMLGLALALGVLIGGPFLRAAGRSAAGRNAKLVATGLAVGLAFTVITGDLVEVSQRFENTKSALDASAESDGTGLRRGIWEGSLAIIGNHWLVGIGQGGMSEVFTRERPADLGEAFAAYDGGGMGSSHNFVLELGVTLGIPGTAALAAVAGLIGYAAWKRRELLGERSWYFLAAFLGYSTIVGLNPIAITSATVAAVLLGMAAGVSFERKGGGFTLAFNPIWPLMKGAGTLIALGALVYSGFAIAAEHANANVLEGGTVSGTSVSVFERSARLFPHERAYRITYVAALQELGRGFADPALLRQAEVELLQYLSDFPGSARDYVRLAEIRVGLREPNVAEALDEARRVDPYGYGTTKAIAKVRSDAADAGLHVGNK